jgi:sterol desaturase/sphingolipid hydroxylase (fatty acid hydroxylase superfamily)
MSTQTLAVVLPILIVAAALLFILLERIFPYDKGQPFFREGFFSDVMLYAIAQSYVLSLVIGAFIDWVDSQTGLSRLRLVGDWPIWAQVTFFLVTHDLYIYWFHRLQHHHKVLWRLH